jgi:hypothetical protein
VDIVQFRFIKTLRKAEKQQCSFTRGPSGAGAAESIAIERMASLEIK